MPVTVVVGTQWGDEGKGKVTDYLAEDADIIVRFQGGTNAGHTVKVGDEVYKFQLLPSGILRPEKTCVIGNGVVVDPRALLRELAELDGRGVTPATLRISERAHVVMPYHKAQDALEEKGKGSLKAGTTMRGIGPCYTDKVARYGIRIVDLLNADALAEKLDVVVPLKEMLFKTLGGEETLSKADLLREHLDYGDALRDKVADTSVLIHEAIEAGKNVLLEGAQGTHLDIDHGVYPYGTSSNPVAGGAAVGAGIGPTRIDHVIGVVKAYTSRVGTGPFPCELEGDVAEHIREKGHEYGTVTGRPRRVGWLDLVMLRFSARVNGLTTLAVTRLDVLGGLETVEICRGYTVNGGAVDEFPADMRLLARCEPVLDEFPCWPDMSEREWIEIAGQGYDALPETVRGYLDHVAEMTGVPVGIISIGASRAATIDVRG
jgi:adenylosuccinate synthase